MSMQTRILGGAIVALLASTGFGSVAFAADTEMAFVECGDTPSPVHVATIKKWEEANPGYKVNVEVVGWGQCQDKVTQLAVALYSLLGSLLEIGSKRFFFHPETRS